MRSRKKNHEEDKNGEGDKNHEGDKNQEGDKIKENFLFTNFTKTEMLQQLKCHQNINVTKTEIH